MLSGAFGAFCARAAESPSDTNAIEAKMDSVFIGGFMVDISLGLVRVHERREPIRAPDVFDSIICFSNYCPAGISIARGAAVVVCTIMAAGEYSFDHFDS
jgi:hypothetical protein